MRLLFVGMLQELLRHGLCMNAGSHVVMPFVAQHTDKFRRQNFIEDSDHGFSIRAVAAGHRTLFHMLKCALAQRLNISYKWTTRFFIGFCSHSIFSLSLPNWSDAAQRSPTQRSPTPRPPGPGTNTADRALGRKFRPRCRTLQERSTADSPKRVNFSASMSVRPIFRVPLELFLRLSAN